MRKIVLFSIVVCLLAGCGKSAYNQQNIVKKEATSPIETESASDTEHLTASEEPRVTEMPQETEASSQPEQPTPAPTEIPVWDIHSSESNEEFCWYFMRNDQNLPAGGAQEVDIQKYNAYYLGDTDRKVIYLTFDSDYENGYSENLLDILKEKNVHAAFFLSINYVKANEEIVKRMVSEGHLVVNHSNGNLHLLDLTDEQVASDIRENAAYFKELTGQDMPRFYRLHNGDYSERILDIADQLGYETVFWSFAYQDWYVDDQPDYNYAYNMMMNNLHNGSIMLLHTVSKTNMEVLPQFIDDAKNLGYSFTDLYDLTPPSPRE